MQNDFSTIGLASLAGWSDQTATRLVHICNLTIGYSGGKVVAQDLNATLEPGSLVCLLGANGTGKSTLIRTLCGFQPALAGEVTLRGNRVASMDAQALAKELSVVLTDRLMVPNATVEELVGYGRSPYTGFLGRLNADDKKKITQAMESCQIIHKRKELLSNLSDGERQKAVIAKALAQDTPLIILDEPTAFLDLPTRVEIMQLLRTLASKSNKAILMSTHDMELALQMADKLWILHKGGPIDTGSPEDLLLSGAFATLFGQTNVEFDIRTGLFKVAYDYQYVLPVSGHGFHYVLLRRAFARKGVKVEHSRLREGLWLNIVAGSKPAYQLYFDSCLLIEHHKIDEVVRATAVCLTSTKTKDTTTNETRHTTHK